MSEISELRSELNELKSRLNALTLGQLDGGTLSRAEFISPFPTCMTNDVESAEFSGVFRSVKGYTFGGIVYHWGIVVLGVLQVGANASGQLLWGAGDVIGDVDGIRIETGTGLPNQIRWFGGTNTYGYIYTDFVVTPTLVVGTAYLDGSQLSILAGGEDVNRIAKILLVSGASGRIEINAPASLVINQDGLDSDVRIEGYLNSDMFFLDAGNNRIGIDKTNPSTTLDINGITSSDSIILREVSAPGTPASGLLHIYPKTDGKLYYKNDAGTEKEIATV